MQDGWAARTAKGFTIISSSLATEDTENDEKNFNFTYINGLGNDDARHSRRCSG